MSLPNNMFGSTMGRMNIGENISRWPRSADLAASRDVGQRDKDGYAMLLGWFERWRTGRGLPPERESARLFWSEEKS